jgi:hypothetical protein
MHQSLNVGGPALCQGGCHSRRSELGLARTTAKILPCLRLTIVALLVQMHVEVGK